MTICCLTTRQAGNLTRVKLIESDCSVTIHLGNSFMGFISLPRFVTLLLECPLLFFNLGPTTLSLRITVADHSRKLHIHGGAFFSSQLGDFLVDYQLQHAHLANEEKTRLMN